MVVLADHLKCGVNFPLPSFLCSLPAFYGIKLYHLAPNSVVFLSVFVHLSEGFLGIHLDLDLFHHFFSSRQTRTPGPIMRSCVPFGFPHARQEEQGGRVYCNVSP